jgi:ParB family chromosome partitioning protein
VRRGGLGRGLSALIPAAAEERGLLDVPIDAVTRNPKQPRGDFAEGTLASLARSIQEVGVLQPIVVRPREHGYELVAGERRLRAAKLAGLVTIPAILRESEDSESLREALIENIHREDLSPLELAAAFQELLEELGTTQEIVADRLGYSRAHVANTIRLLSLPPDVQRLLAERRIQAGHGRALLALEDDEGRSALALRIAAEGLSVREVERLVKAYVARPVPRSKGDPPRDAALGAVEEMLVERLRTNVVVSMGKRKGRIVIDVGSPDDLERLVAVITGAGRPVPPDPARAPRPIGESDDPVRRP